MKEHNELDQTMRAKLGQLNPDMQPGSWDVLADKLEAADRAAAFDRHVGDKLEGVRVPYRQSSWAVLAARLELQRQRIRAVLHYKAMEISLLLLLLLTVWPYLPSGVQPLPAPPAGIPIAQGLDATAPAATTPAAPQQSAIPADITAVAEPTTNTAAPNHSSDHSQASLDIHTKVTSALAGRQPAAPQVQPLDGATDPQEQLRGLIAKKADQITTPSDNYPDQGALAALDDMPTAFIQYNPTDDLLEYLRPSERQTFVRIGFVGGPEYNRVITPTQEIVDGVEVYLDRYSLGYGGGITVGVEHGKWELETGLLYAARRYQAVPALYVSGNITDGYSGISLRNFELNTVNIPLHFRYNFLVHNKWRLYAQGGASLNLIISANYYIANEDSFEGISRNLDSSNGISRADKSALLGSKSLIPGIFETGSFRENATLYTDIAVGVERYMTANWSLFVQPTYRHGILLFNEGVGPYNDRIHNFGMGMGVKVRL